MKSLVLFFVFALFMMQGVFLHEKLFAVSEDAVIYQVQTGGVESGSAKQELIIIYNSSENDINITDWCIEYRSSSYSLGFSRCIDAPVNVQFWLTSGGMVSFATNEFVDANDKFAADFIMSGGMSSTAGHVVLVNHSKTEIDKIGWGDVINPEGLSAKAHSSGEVLSRDLTAENIDSDVNVDDFASRQVESLVVSGIYEVEVPVDICENLTGLQVEIPNGYLQDEVGDCYKDICPNIDELQKEVPAGYEVVDMNCEEIPLEGRTLFITELLPNPSSYDTDNEFIELYNPNDEQINLSGYKIQVGPSYSKEFEFTDGVILPGEYLVFNDGITGITLPNSNGVALRIVAPNGEVVSQTEVYSNASDDVSWALVDDQWIFTNQITPDGPNKPYLEPVVNEVEGTTTVYAPCPVGKFRNPETNRCKNVETAVSQLTPCDEDEYRNPDTNRCRKISSASSSLTPCDEGQERNPETNRCRKISTLGTTSQDDLNTVTDLEAKNTEGDMNWAIIGTALAATFGYMVYEWRVELARAMRRN